MTDTPPPELPVAVVAPPRRFRIPPVWIIPLLTALIGLFLVVRTHYEQGPTITLEFKSGEGLEPGKTRIKFKSVEVGQITAVTLSEDSSHVVATARVAREAARLLVEDTRFWVVNARVSGGSVSGLETLLAGPYVGMDAGKSTLERRAFVALESGPVIAMDVPGRAFTLLADSLGSISVGTPVYFRRIPAGQVTGFQLGALGKRIDVQIFVKAPYDRFVTADSRFWNASGVDVKLGADGVEVNTESVASILTGGLAFQTPDGANDEPAPPAHSFRLFADRAAALKQPHLGAQTYLLRFSDSVRGLSVGAPVDFRGIPVGEVTAIRPEIDTRTVELGLLVEVAIYPERMQGQPDAGARALAGKDYRDRDFRAFLDKLVAKGLRAQLRSGNLVTGQLYVALELFPHAAPGRVDWGGPQPRLPTQRGSLDELQTTLQRIVDKLDQLPLDALGKDTRRALAGLTRTLGEAEGLLKRLDSLAGGDVRDTVQEARAAIAEGRRLVASDAPLQQELRASLQEVARAAQALRQLADTLERHPEALLRGKPEEKP